MESILKTIFLILGGIVVLGLIILFLPVLILAYILMPKRSTQTWFNTFAQQARNRGAKQKPEPASSYYSKIPASEDIIDVTADEIEDKK